MHYEENTKKREILLIFMFLIMICYGIYKNGLTYYFLGKLSFIEALKPVLFPLLGIFISIAIKSIKEKKIAFSRKDILLGIFYGLVMPTEFPIIIYCLFVTVFTILKELLKMKFFMISWLALYKVIEMILSCTLNIGLENKIEASIPYLYGILDTFFGRNVGAFGTTNIFLILIIYGILCTSFYYKKELPITSIVSYLILFFGYFFFFQNRLELKDALNSTFLFVAITILPINKTTPGEKKEENIYGISFGILSFIFIHVCHIIEGAYLSLLLINILWNLYFPIWKKQWTKKDKNYSLQK